jgi:hypothetical protein
MSGWDPLTGQAIAGDDLTDLIKAAGGTPSLPAAPDTSNTLCIKLMTGGGDEALQQFYTLDVHEAQSRICSFFESVQNPTMHVKIEFGHLTAIAFRDAQHRVQTSWMDKSVMKTTPAMVYYTATEFPAWAYKISNCFLNVIKIRNEINRIKEIASRRTTGSSEVVNTTPPTPWLEAQAPSMFQQGVVCGAGGMHDVQQMQGVMYA